MVHLPWDANHGRINSWGARRLQRLMVQSLRPHLFLIELCWSYERQQLLIGAFRMPSILEYQDIAYVSDCFLFPEFFLNQTDWSWIGWVREVQRAAQGEKKASGADTAWVGLPGQLEINGFCEVFSEQRAANWGPAPWDAIHPSRPESCVALSESGVNRRWENVLAAWGK